MRTAERDSQSRLERTLSASGKQSDQGDRAGQTKRAKARPGHGSYGLSPLAESGRCTNLARLTYAPRPEGLHTPWSGDFVNYPPRP